MGWDSDEGRALRAEIERVEQLAPDEHELRRQKIQAELARRIVPGSESEERRKLGKKFASLNRRDRANAFIDAVSRLVHLLRPDQVEVNGRPQDQDQLRRRRRFRKALINSGMKLKPSRPPAGTTTLLISTPP